MPADAATVVDIVLASRRIARFLADVEETGFAANEEKRWAVVSQLLVIGEGVRRLSSRFRAQHAQVPWQQIAGMRNRLIHEYDKINWSLVWRTATQDVPPLLEVLEPYATAPE